MSFWANQLNCICIGLQKLSCRNFFFEKIKKINFDIFSFFFEAGSGKKDFTSSLRIFFATL